MTEDLDLLLAMTKADLKPAAVKHSRMEHEEPNSVLAASNKMADIRWKVTKVDIGACVPHTQPSEYGMTT